MKTFKKFYNESVIDPVRSTYAKDVFEDADTDNPKIKSSIKALIKKQIDKFSKEYPVISYHLVGSILTHKYRDDADLDINVYFDVPKDKQEEEELRLSKSLKDINGKEVPGTKHPINYYVIASKEGKKSADEKVDALFDIVSDKWIKKPKEQKFDYNLYADEFEKKVKEIDAIKGELKRDIVDYYELSSVSKDEIKNLSTRLEKKLKEIEKDLKDVKQFGDKVDSERRKAFDSNMTPDELRKYGIKNALPPNVIYKLLEKYHYITLYKKCKEILEDDKVTDDEIDDVKKMVSKP